MGTLSGYFVLCLVWGVAQVLAAQNDHEPMVAFKCGLPAMHKGVNGWIPDDSNKECWIDKKPILEYCKQVYPNHNITNVVEASYLVSIPGWPSSDGSSPHTQHVRPYRCIVDTFQSDALLVPQHCKFDHKHDETVCKGFSHWEVVARDACAKDGMHCESFGMLLNCGLGTFSGVEYVCCPTEDASSAAAANNNSDNSDDDDESEDQDEGDEDDSDFDAWESRDTDLDDTSKVNLYEKYLKGEPMPTKLHNEHQRFVAARQFMHKLQEAKNTQLMKEWTAARDHVNEVRKTDPRTAEKLSKEITERFQRLYNAYEQEDIAEKQQIVALHQQKVQFNYNQKKRAAMDRYMKSLEKGDVARIAKNLHNYIKAEERDSMHTVKHYSHVKATMPAEAARMHAHVIQHLKLCQQRMEQALEMLERYPEIERKVRPEIEDFMKKYDDMATRIRNVVLPDPTTSNIHTDNDNNSDDVPADNNAEALPQRIQKIVDNMNDDSDASEDSIEEDSSERENEHDYLSKQQPVAHAQHNRMSAQQTLQASPAASSVQLGTTFGIAIGSVAIFVVLVVAVVMLRRRSSSRMNVTHGYVEVDPAASPEERHVANMQMNGYENPTYRYFEVQTAK